MAASAVLNGTRTSARISAETEERIRTAAAALNYRPNVAARALVNRRMNTIGISVVVEGGDLNHYFLEVFNGIIEAAARLGQNSTVFAVPNWESALPQLQRSCDGRIDGMILIAPLLTAEAGAKLPGHTPFVTLHANHPVHGAINIESSEEDGARAMVEDLIRRGHRRILHISGPRGMIGVERRLRGVQTALADAGIAWDPALFRSTSFNHTGGMRALRQWIQDNADQPLPQAIFGGSDAIAMGCIEALAEIGVRVPEDVSVAGFDDTLVARTSIPQLSTVRQPLRVMGNRAVEVLLERIENQPEEAWNDTPPPIIFPTELVERASVAATARDPGAMRVGDFLPKV